MSDFPEHDKMQKINEESQAIGEFLATCGFTLCRWVPADELDDDETDIGDLDGLFLSVRGSITQILASHFKIDLDLIEDEKRQMIGLPTRERNRT